MALIRFPQSTMLIEVDDKVIGSTIIKRKVRITALNYDMINRRVIIDTMVVPFAADVKGGYGDALSGTKNFQESFVSLVADMNGIVEAKTGTFLGEAMKVNHPGVFDEGGELYGIDVMYEFEFYKMVATYQPVIIDEMIKQVVQRAAHEGKF